MKQLQSWSARALERQISTLYYERLLSTQGNSKVFICISWENKNYELTTSVKVFCDLYFDFLGLPSSILQENKLEQTLIENLKEFLLELGKGFALSNDNNVLVLMMVISILI